MFPKWQIFVGLTSGYQQIQFYISDPASDTDNIYQDDGLLGIQVCCKLQFLYFLKS